MGEVAGAVAINNHASKFDQKGKNRIKSGRDMIAEMYGVLCSLAGPEPFKPSDVDYGTALRYVDEEVARNPQINKTTLLMAIERLIPVTGRKRRSFCNIL